MFKTHLIKIYFVLIAMSFASFSFGQRCSQFHKYGDCKTSESEGFSYYGQSRSALIEIRKPTIFKAVFYGQRDYKVVLCTEYGYYPVHFVITNADTDEVLYDNKEDDYIESVGFTLEKTQNLIFTINILAEDIDPEDSFDARACAGVNILWRKVPKLGF